MKISFMKSPLILLVMLATTLGSFSAFSQTLEIVKKRINLGEIEIANGSEIKRVFELKRVDKTIEKVKIKYDYDTVCRFRYESGHEVTTSIGGISNEITIDFTYAPDDETSFFFVLEKKDGECFISHSIDSNNSDLRTQVTDNYQFGSVLLREFEKREIIQIFMQE